MYRAGRFRDTIKIIPWKIRTNEYGEGRRFYSSGEAKTLKAEVQLNSGSRSIVNDENYVDNSITFVIRDHFWMYQPNTSFQWSVFYEGAEYYIDSLEHDRINKVRLIKCSRAAGTQSLMGDLQKMLENGEYNTDPLNEN